MATDPKPTEAEEQQPPTSGFLKKLESASLEAGRKLLGIPTKPESERFEELTPAQKKRLQEIEYQAIAQFEGDLNQLETALGMLRLGFHFGWKVLYIIHSKRTIRIYEDILKIKIREEFPETGKSSYRSFGFQLSEKFSNFWRVASGDIKIPRRKDATS